MRMRATDLVIPMYGLSYCPNVGLWSASSHKNPTLINFMVENKNTTNTNTTLKVYVVD